MGLPSDSESHTSDSERPPTANASQDPLPTPAQPRSQSTTSTAKSDDSDDKHSKFDERFQTATSTDEDVLSTSIFCDSSVLNLDRLSTERQMATWTSQVYQHFKMPPTIAVKNGKVIYVYTCIA
jgi:hypothetical protein